MTEEIRIGGLHLRFLRSKHDTNGALDLFEMVVQPEGRMPVPHSHRDWEETVYGLAGRLVFTVAGTEVEIGPGDSVFIPRGAVHGFDNRTCTPATCLCVLTPGILGPRYFRELAAALESGLADPAVMREIMTRHGLIPAPQADTVAVSPAARAEQ